MSGWRRPSSPFGAPQRHTRGLFRSSLLGRRPATGSACFVPRHQTGAFQGTTVQSSDSRYTRSKHARLKLPWLAQLSQLDGRRLEVMFPVTSNAILRRSTARPLVHSSNRPIAQPYLTSPHLGRSTNRKRHYPVLELNSSKLA